LKYENFRLNVPASFATKRRAIAADRGLVLRVLRGFVEAIHRFKKQASAIVPLLQEFLGFRRKTHVALALANHQANHRALAALTRQRVARRP